MQAGVCGGFPMTDKPFRSRDRVTVHWPNGTTAPGRVICHNRKSKYGLTIIVLADRGDDESPESFMPNGHRWLKRDGCYITHGWEKDLGKEGQSDEENS